MDQAVRKSVQEQKGAECHFCGVTEEQHKQEYDRGLDTHHKLPERLGGTADMGNLIPVCIDCHKKLESITRDILPSGRTDEYEDIPKHSWDEIKDTLSVNEELKEAKENAKYWKECHDDAIGAYKGLLDGLKQRQTITVHVVHESKVVTSTLRYVGTDEDKAVKKYRECENSATLETAKITDLTPVELIDPRHVSSDIATDGVVDMKDELNITDMNERVYSDET